MSLKLGIILVCAFVFIYCFKQLKENFYFPPFSENFRTQHTTRAILKGDTVEQEIKTKYQTRFIENIISNNRRLNTDSLQFSVVDIESNTLVTEKILRLGYVTEEYLEDFAIPISVDLSKNKRYKIRYISLNGKENNSYSLYYYPKSKNHFTINNKIYEGSLALKPIYYPENEFYIILEGVIYLSLCISIIILLAYLIFFKWWISIKCFFSKRHKIKKIRLNLKLLKTKNFRLDYAFVIIMLFFGLIIQFIVPMGDVSDELLHAYSSYNLAKGYHIKHETGNKTFPKKLDKFTSFAGNVFYGVDAEDSLVHLIKPYFYRRLQNTYKDSINIDYLTKDDFSENHLMKKNKIGHATFFDHFASSLGVTISDFLFKFIGIKYKVLSYLRMMRIFNLLGHILLCFVIIRYVKYYKELFFTICLLPTTVYYASGISYDGINIAFTLLFIAYLINLIFDKNKKRVPIRELMVFLLLCIGMGLLKGVYFPVLFFILLVPSYKLNFFKKITLCIAGFLLFAYVYSANKYNINNEISDLAKKSNNTTITQNQKIIINDTYIYQKPLTFIGILANDITYSKIVYITEVFCMVGWGSNLLPFIFIVLLILLIWYALTISKVPNKGFILFSIFCFAIFFIVFAGIDYVFYKGKSAVEIVPHYYRVWGVLGRYFIPILILIPLGLKLRKNFIFKIPKSSLPSHRFLLAFAHVIILTVSVIFTVIRYYSPE